ncbi:MAG TPA: aminopeptidase P N-terminal domain-containing protein [Blastocatellia bacterium]|nr:aminopeptidase P N-terminal domain-containing protein [Blastocatellia bacterium]HMX26425.1 aminopeptidase P N-terminal domain-containing protein [Blastocatellia bacterium]HMY70823.1 aminopeptidase P N-terminal domain-containing protein [Blastocatellia bacterium]HMZ17834.1 aminopeptidase P N-terminal domain-containing protein [Blastocatellia bacterium]HNG29694.1 aminopeptidase P N-terminal domain-containing protein [Blastocatellia bacterium]
MKPTRLAEFLARMEPSSVAVFAGAHEIRRNQDTDFEFRQETDFYYLTRLNEPDCVAVLAPNHPEHKYVLFVRPRKREEEIWTGLRAGVEGAIRDFGADAAYDIARLDELLPKYLQNSHKLYYRFGQNQHFDLKVIGTIKNIRERIRTGVYAPNTIIDPATVVHEMRMRKNEDDLRDLRRAAQISAEGHVAAMKHCKPGMYEYELEALIEYVFRKNGATGVGYPSIVGAGFNTTILHYNTNQCRINDGDMVLIDAGAEYNVFSGDITRSFPANGKFTKAQQAIYEVVLNANKEVIKMVKPGVSFMKLHERSIEVVTQGLLDLGLLSGSLKDNVEGKAYEKFFMHRTGHWLGMDVHDVGRYKLDDDWRTLEPGMVFTVEPGVYIAAGAEQVPEEFFNIGVRIEDDVVVTESGVEVLTTGVPKEAKEVEATMKQSTMAAA